MTWTKKDYPAWQRCVDANWGDPTGMGRVIIEYTERWASLMEKRLDNGESLKDIADATSHEADIAGITGAMWHCALCTLRDTWIHGSDLFALYEERKGQQ